MLSTWAVTESEQSLHSSHINARHFAQLHLNWCAFRPCNINTLHSSSSSSSFPFFIFIIYYYYFFFSLFGVHLFRLSDFLFSLGKIFLLPAYSSSRFICLLIYTDQSARLEPLLFSVLPKKEKSLAVLFVSRVFTFSAFAIQLLLLPHTYAGTGTYPDGQAMSSRAPDTCVSSCLPTRY